MRHHTAILVALFALSADVRSQNATPVGNYDQATCGSMKMPFQHGPFDYRTQTPMERELVEAAHFTADIEALKGKPISEKVRNNPGADIDYTLRAFPNHPRALFALVRLQEKEGKLKPAGLRWPVPCYFTRAIHFTPSDGNVRLVFGIYLLKGRDKDGAVRELELAKNMLPDDSNVAYNLGLAYFESGKYDQATAEAKRARDLGFSLDGLQNKLKRVGKWTE